MKPKVTTVQVYADRETGSTRAAFFRQGKRLQDVTLHIYPCNPRRLQRMFVLITQLLQKDWRK
jgi:hypothetical protein